MRMSVPEPVKNLCDTTRVNTIVCLLGHDASSFCE
jgi:hypothetical protein